MNFGFTLFYREPNHFFEVDWKILPLIGKKVRSLIKQKYPGCQPFDVAITAASSASATTLETDYIRKNLLYTIVLPYDLIVSSPDQKQAFVKYLFDGLAIIFEGSPILPDDLDKLQSSIQNEIAQQPEYEFIPDKSYGFIKRF